jgi:hypothetical protein
LICRLGKWITAGSEYATGGNWEIKDVTMCKIIGIKDEKA